MASTATNPKIEELRARLKADPKSRIFFPLAEELRKAGNNTEAEKVLRDGLVLYPTYLGAWVGLGRVLHERKDDAGAVEALNTALQLDPGNVVAARLLADAYLALGEKVEAIKKYKLVHALLPSDDDLRATIEQLDRDLHPPAVSEVTEAEYESASAPEGGSDAIFPPVVEEESPFSEDAAVASPFAPEPSPALQSVEEESPFDKTAPPFAEALRSYEAEVREDVLTGDAEPMGLEHEESPFEEPAGEYSSDALAIEDPLGMQVTEAPLSAELPGGYEEDLPVTDATASFDDTQAIDSDAADTATMADLYVKQGLVDQARHIYENILAREPGNDAVREKLLAIAPAPVAGVEGNPKVARLESWLSKITRKEADGV